MAIGYVKHCSRSDDAVIRVHDAAGNVIYGCADSAVFSLYKTMTSAIPSGGGQTPIDLVLIELKK